MRNAALLLAILLLAPAALPEEGGRSALIPVRGRLSGPQVERIVAQLTGAVSRGATRVVLELEVEESAGEEGLSLVDALAKLPEEVEVTCLVTGRAPRSAVAVLLAADRAVATSGGSVGPIPTSGPIHDAVLRGARKKGLPAGTIDGLLSVSLGGGLLDAEAAVAAGLLSRAYDDRAEALNDLGARDDAPAAPRGGRLSVQGPFAKAFVIPLVGQIDDTMAASVRRRVRFAMESGADLLVFDIDSPGGYVSSSMEIGDYIFGLRIPTVMLILGGGEHQGAYSGAALISLGGNEIVMGDGGIIGDCQPIAIGPGGYEVLGEKIQSPLRALFRKYAERNGYPVRMSEAMITEEMEVHRVTFADGHRDYVLAEDIEGRSLDHGSVTKDEIVVRKGELLTMTAQAAREHGFCGELVTDRDDALRRFGVTEAGSPVLEETWAERVSRFLLGIKGLLFFVGIIALYMELKAPGFGVPGALALVCFALFFAASAIAGISTAIEVILFLLGVALLVVELFLIPGFGVPGIAGVLLIVSSLYMASVKFGLPDFDRPWEVRGFLYWGLELGVSFLAALLAMFFLARFLPKTAIGRRLILAPAGPAGSQGLTGSGSEAGRRAADLVGRRGTAATDLRPAGRIEIDGEPWDAVTDGDYLDRGVEVEVLRVAANRIVVREA